MKISSDHNPTVPTLGKAPTTKAAEKERVVKPHTSPAPQAEGKDLLRSKIVDWFAHAGISKDSSSAKQPNISEKLKRRQQIWQLRKYNNLQSVLDSALSFSLDQSNDEALDPDWFFSFIKLAEDVHSPAMQEVWGKIFAVETSHPGSFAIPTLQTLTQLTQREADVFSTAVNLASRQKGAYAPKLLVGFNQKPGILSLFALQKSQQLNLAQFGIAFPDLLTLIDRGLIYSTEIESGELKTDKVTQWRCGDEHFTLTPKRKGIALHYYKFTMTGTELARLVNAKPNNRYTDELRQTLSPGFVID